MQKEPPEKPRRAVMAAVQLPNVTDLEFKASVTELDEQAKTLGFAIVHKRRHKRCSGQVFLQKI